MFNFTAIARTFMERRVRAARRWSTPSGAEAGQRAVLADLLKRARHTAVGERYDFAAIRSYEDFARKVPVVEYEDIRADVMRMVGGEAGVLWPGRCRYFAQSSGTSGGRSKFIPVTDFGLRHNHYAGTRSVVAHYLHQYPDSRLFGGKSFILGGSFNNELHGMHPGVRVGDLSATLIDHIPAIGEFFRVPSKKTALLTDWHEKLPALIKESATEDITNISGVPSWFLTVLRGVIEYTGATTIHDVWPNLEVFFHGGIAFGPYREQYRAITDPAKMRYMETYNASEGFFALADSREAPGMLLLLDTGVFYEFIPLDSVGQSFPESALPAWKAEPRKTYALAISSCNGLWRYAIGDTVRIESENPLRISIAGRTKAFINAFGEELMVWNAEAALAEACRRTGAEVAEYTAAPVYADSGHRGHHQWLIEWSRRPDCGAEAFADILDTELQRVNSDYQAKRSGGIFLDRLQLTEVPAGTFSAWLASTGKLGGQRKVPRLANDRRVAEAVLLQAHKLEYDTSNTQKSA